MPEEDEFVTRNIFFVMLLLLYSDSFFHQQVDLPLYFQASVIT